MDSNQIFPKIKLNSGHEFPTFGLGCMDIEKHGHLSPEFLTSALDIGYRHFDIARLYMNEKQFGESFKQVVQQGKYKRSDIFLTTKTFLFADKNLVDILKEALADL